MRLKIRAKLLLGFAVVLVILLVVGLLSINSLNQVTDVNHRAIQANEQVLFFSEVVAAHLVWANELANSFLYETEFTGELDYSQCTFGQWYYAFIESQEFRELTPQAQRLLTDMEAPHRTLHVAAADIVDIMEDPAGDMDEAMGIYESQIMGTLEQLGDGFDDLSRYFQQYSQSMLAEADEVERRADMLTVVGLVAGILLGIVIALVISQAIVKPLNNITNRLRDIAEKGGDLTQKVQVTTKDELADLAEGFNNFVDNIRSIMLQVRNSSDTVATASEEISAGNQDLSQRTEEQASSLEEVSSTLEQLTASWQQVSDNATEADRISKATYEKVKDGETVVDNMQGAMSSITTSSEQIAEIISKVNDIAFQTNLLALNAAVEAARAGEQGRGFAVVAAEVRNLARRSSESAKDIEKLIKESIQNVAQGNELMGQTSSVLSEIITNTERTVDVIGEIAASMREQSSASSEIRTAIDELNQVTQQNASMVEEIASSSESMQSEAMELNELLGRFILGEENKKRTSFEAKPPAPKRQETREKRVENEPRNVEGGEIFDEDFDEGDFEKF